MHRVDLAELAEATRVRFAFDRLARQVFVRVAVTIAAMTATLVYLMLALSAASSEGPDVLLLATLATALTAASCGALAPLVRRNRRLREDIDRLEACVESLSDRLWELRENEERTKTLLEAHGDVIVRRDGEGRIVYANAAFCALAGRQHDAVIDERSGLTVLEEREPTQLPDGTRTHDQKIETAAGPRWLSWHDVSVRTDAGERVEIQSVGRDITDRVLVERALADARDQADAANNAKGRFLAMVSHEIRTPLNGILGMADLLRDTTLSAEQTTYVNAVRTSGDTLLSLIEDILDFSKIEAGRFDLDPRPFELESLVEGVVELLSPRAQAKSIEIAAFVDERLAHRVLGDAPRLRQVLLNLTGNAVKFTEKGGVSIVVEPGAEPDAVLLQVRDTGIGILPADRAKIFEEFEQADRSAARASAGTGLGLTISSRIVARMGGRIDVDSVPGVGSTFSFIVALPRADAEEGTAASPNLAGTSALLIAANATEIGVVARRLAGWGARICIVADAERALAELKTQAWDIVMVDNALGLAAATRIARDCPPAAAHRIVLVTPQSRSDLQALKEAGFTGYLVKPVRAVSLAARLQTEPEPFERAEARDIESISTRGKPTKNLAVLVAEDNDINALLANALLARLGHRPTVVASGEAAVESFIAARAAGAPYDLVLMDLQMPGIGGLVAARRMRAHEAGAARTRILALTANVTARDREACIAAGMDGFLEKPFDRERLIEALSSTAAAIAA